MLRDQVLNEFRHTYYRLFVLLWWQEPAASVLTAIRQESHERIAAAAALHPLLGEGWQVMQQVLAEQTPEDIAAEYTQLFLGPYGPEVNPYESYYLTGHLLRTPLVELRGFLARLGIEKQAQEFAEPEDVLAFELDVMRWLITKQMAASSPEEADRWLQEQAVLLTKHLLIWGPTCAQDIEKAPRAQFYRGAAMVLRGFLALEQELLQSQGFGEIPSLEEARQRYGGQATWHGPVFDVSTITPESFPSSQEPDMPG